MSGLPPRSVICVSWPALPSPVPMAARFRQQAILVCFPAWSARHWSRGSGDCVCISDASMILSNLSLTPCRVVSSLCLCPRRCAGHDPR